MAGFVKSLDRKARATVDEVEHQDLLAMRKEMLDYRKETPSLHSRMIVLQTEVPTIGAKQNDLNVAMGGVQKSVSDLGLQLVAMNEVLESLNPCLRRLQRTKHSSMI